MSQLLKDKDIKLLEDQDDLENYKGKWVNVDFEHNGRSVLDIEQFNTEEEAKEDSDNFIASVYNDPSPPGTEKMWEYQTTGEKMYLKDYSHSIQMPLGE